MERKAGFALLAAIAIALAAMLVLALVAVPTSSRTLSIEELRAGVDFVLGGVRVQETYFRDLSQVDAGTDVAFLLHFPDATSENVSFVFQTFLCSDVTAASTHHNPQVVFHAFCGESSVLVAVL